MKDNLKAKNGVFDTVLVAVCSFVGVGFITGAEIWFYFARFGANSIFGLICFGVLIFVLSYFAINSREENKSKLNLLKTKILICSELFVASAMISGLLETTRTLFFNWHLFVSLIAICLLAFLFYFDKKSFVLYNYFVAIFVIFVIVTLFLFNNKNCIDFNVVNFENSSFKLSLFSVLFSCFYVFMNISEIRPILERNSKNFSKKKKILVSFVLSLTLILLAFIIIIILLNNNDIANKSMPFLIKFKNKGGVSLWVFLVGLVMTMISTAQACLIGVKNKLKFDKNDENFIKIIVIILILILGQIPFKIFIKIIYPILAVLNLLVFCLEIFQSRKNKNIKNF